MFADAHISSLGYLWSQPTKVWHRTYAICDALLSRTTRRCSALNSWRTEALPGIAFVQAKQLRGSGIE